MAQDMRIVAATRSNMLGAISTDVGASGLLRIYGGGSGRPATGAAITDQTLLAELALSATMETTNTGGVLTFATISDDTSANATGTAAWARITTAGGAAVVDLEVGTSASDINFDSVAFVTGGNVAVSSLVWTAGNA